MNHDLQMHLAELQRLNLKDNSNRRRHLWLIRQLASFDTRPSHPATATPTSMICQKQIF